MLGYVTQTQVFLRNEFGRWVVSVEIAHIRKNDTVNFACD